MAVPLTPYDTWRANVVEPTRVIVNVPACNGFSRAFASVATTVTTGITYRQLAAPDELRSSVNTFGRMISWGGQPFGAAAGALIASALDVRAAYLFAATSMMISAICAFVFLRPSTLIDRHDEPAARAPIGSTAGE